MLMTITELEKYNFERVEHYESIYEKAVLKECTPDAAKNRLIEILEYQKNAFRNLDPEEAAGAKQWAREALQSNMLDEMERRKYDTALKYMSGVSEPGLNSSTGINLNRVEGIINTFFERGPRIERLEHLISKLHGMMQNNTAGANNDQEQKLFDLFPVFLNHSKFLKAEGYYKNSKNKLVWVHGGNLLLAGYFGMIQEIPGAPRKMWGEIERAFNVTHLAQFYSDYEALRKGKTNKHEKYDKKLRDLVQGKAFL